MASKSISASSSKNAPQQKRPSDKKRSGERDAGPSSPSAAAKKRSKAAEQTESGS